MNILQILSHEWFAELGKDCNAHFFRFELPAYRFDNKHDKPTKLNPLEDSHELFKLFGQRSVWSTVNYGKYPQKDALGFSRFDELPGWSTPAPEKVATFIKSESSILGLDEIKVLRRLSPTNPVWERTREYGRLGLGYITSGILVPGILHILHVESGDAHLSSESFSKLLPNDLIGKMIKNLYVVVGAAQV